MILKPAGSVPLCRDCRHHQSGNCTKAEDVVTGATASCKHTRGDEQLCGPEGKWFDPPQAEPEFQDNRPTVHGTPIDMHRADDHEIMKRINNDVARET